MRWALVLLLCIASEANAHENHPHSNQKNKEPSVDRTELLKQINEKYKSSVAEIFKKSCFDCHSQNPRLPWYYVVPGARGIMKEDMIEAKKHLDMTADFPFKGHGSPEEDLKAIRKSIEEETMPPIRYRILHWGVGLNEKEKKTVLSWIEDSKKVLEEKK